MASKYPNLITVKQAIPFGTTIEGQPVYYVKISDNANIDETEPEVLYSAVHHARARWYVTIDFLYVVFA
ncbi:MAG: hypothetical protein IPG39_06420 [Bacteroidetes bacterium]|nr:hypothetical protein [Bacteroidota bacterium]